MPTLAAPGLSDDLRVRLDTLDIDVSCAMRFSRATVYALAAMSKEARDTLDRCLAEEAAIVQIEDLDGSAAVAAMLNEARHHLRATADDGIRAATRGIERIQVESAAGLSRISRAANRD